MAHLTKKGALIISRDFDRIATLVTAEWKSLGIPEKIARDFEHRCDLLSDRVERTAGMDPTDKAATAELLRRFALDHKTDYPFDEGKSEHNDEIGEETGGPLEGDGDEPYMKGEFSQQEYRELSDAQESGAVSGVNTDPRGPRPGMQASFGDLVATLKEAAPALDAAGQARVAEAIRLAAGVVREAKGMNPGFKEFLDKKKEKDGDKGDDKDDKKDDKKASHGYDLQA